VDSLYGGFLTTFTYNFLPTGPQDKMIVTQATTCMVKCAGITFISRVDHYKKCAAHGFSFLKDKMWDKTNWWFLYTG
jgi:mannobiose 2-epimerase